MKYFTAIAAAAMFLLPTTAAFADADLASGEKVFKKCMACHAVGEGAKNKVGPQLNDVFGRVAGTLESYEKKYSKAMKAAGEDGLVWNEETLTEYLAKPKAMVKGTKMTFVGLKEEQDIEDIVAYLQTFSPDYVAEE